jgi:hypothetical protein
MTLWGRAGHALSSGPLILSSDSAFASPRTLFVPEELVTKLSTFKRDVVGAPLWVCFKALLAGSPPPRSHYVVPYRPSENMYIVPSDDTVVVVHAISFENHVEQAIARVFLQVCLPLSAFPMTDCTST